MDKVYGGITITKGRTRRRHDQDGVHGVGKERGGEGSEEKGVRKSERKTQRGYERETERKRRR